MGGVRAKHRVHDGVEVPDRLPHGVAAGWQYLRCADAAAGGAQLRDSEPSGDGEARCDEWVFREVRVARDGREPEHLAAVRTADRQ